MSLLFKAHSMTAAGRRLRCHMIVLFKDRSIRRKILLCLPRWVACLSMELAGTVGRSRPRMLTRARRSTRLDLTPYVNFGRDKQLAIRLENPADSARWYPGAGVYRNVWLTKVDSTHVAQWGTYVISNNVSAQSATLDLTVQVENTAATERDVEVLTDVYLFDPGARVAGEKVAEFTTAEVNVPAGQTRAISGSVTI